MEDQANNWDDDPTQETGPQNTQDSVQELADQIDQQLQYVYDYLQRALEAGEPNYNEINSRYDQIVREYEPLRSAALTLQSQNVDAQEIQQVVNNLLVIREYINGLVRIIDGQPEDRQTSMISGGTSGEVITMEEVGPVRSWWSGLSDTTRLLIKGAGIGLAIFIGKRMLDSAMKNMKLQQVSEVRKELEEELQDQNQEEQE